MGWPSEVVWLWGPESGLRLELMWAILWAWQLEGQASPSAQELAMQWLWQSKSQLRLPVEWLGKAAPAE